MSNNRIDEVVSALADAVREAVREKNISFEEYRTGIGYMMEVAKSGELPLFIDVFLNAAVVGVINQNAHPNASPSDMEGPYFLEDVPEVTDKIKTMDDDRCEPMLLRGTVKDVDGQPLPGTTIYIWSSTPDGRYGGIHEGLSADLYRGKLTTDSEGRYQVETRAPVPYQIPHQGPTGKLLELMGKHSWRPAHVHYKIRRDGYRELITQAYFEGGDYVDSDCCEGIVPAEFVMERTVEDGKVVFDIDFTIEPINEAQAA